MAAAWITSGVVVTSGGFGNAYFSASEADQYHHAQQILDHM